MEGLFNLCEEADGNQQWDILKNIVNSGCYVAQGEAIPVSELEAKGGMTRVMSMSLLYQFNLSAAEKEKYGTFPDWLQAIANDPANFSPNEHLDMGSNISGRGGIAWWAPRAEQQGNTMAELVEELGLNPASYEGGAVRVTLSAEASNMNGFKKPTALDGIFFAEWEAAPGNVWGVTSGGSLEAIAEAIPLSQATQLEYLSANLPTPLNLETTATEAFSMSGEGHTLTLEYDGDETIDITMASDDPRFLFPKIASYLNANPNSPAKSELNSLQPWFETEKRTVITTTTPKCDIPGQLEILNQTLAQKIASIGNKYGLHDLSDQVFDVQLEFDTIKAQVNNELHKHLGQSNTLGDGHNNTATACEAIATALGANIAQFSGKAHREKTENAINSLTPALDRLDLVINTYGADLTAHPDYSWYQIGLDELADCNLALSNPNLYLSNKGYNPRKDTTTGKLLL